MRKIRFYRFKPSTQPPDTMDGMNDWMNGEISDAAIEPIDVYTYTNQGVTGEANDHYPMALRIFKYVINLKSAYNWLKKKLHG
ncbi:hypothetical protein [Aquimarina spongiae]|uniref:Uncharacterized protein n=1 Tax=Aquimarina spongiae TaxID=570521 RepID=A0A1M6B729_9FLAO|nr:hypothetical protein [Aquimarina spongiae]SHI44554.1 hypothetical protein SAMN04488508_101664 [Aquimarina spongiae]